LSGLFSRLLHGREDICDRSPGYRAASSLNETGPTAGTESRIHSAATARWYDALIIATSSSVNFPALGRSRTSLTSATAILSRQYFAFGPLFIDQGSSIRRWPSGFPTALTRQTKIHVSKPERVRGFGVVLGDDGRLIPREDAEEYLPLVVRIPDRAPTKHLHAGPSPRPHAVSGLDNPLTQE
jgi:hypothetical protein